MRPYRLATPAFENLQTILHYLAQFGPTPGSRFLYQLDQRLRLLARYPNMGARREEFGHRDLRYIAFGNYLVAYDPAAKPLTVIAIRHGARTPATTSEDPS